MNRIPLYARKSKEAAKEFLNSAILSEFDKNDILVLNKWCHDKKEIFSEVISKKYLGMMPVIDLTVEEDHSYSANGIIVHNCNLPNSATKETVNEVYLRAWESGCKGFTIYRDGCRTGVLVSTNTDKPKETEIFKQHDAPKRPKELECDIYHSTVQGEKWSIFIGMLDGKPYEIMGGLAKFVKIPKRVVKGKLLKHNGEINPARYDLHYDFEKGTDEETIIADVGNIFENPTHSGFTRMISLSLRHGTPIQYVVEQLSKAADKDSDLFSITKAFSRVLKNYVKDGTKLNKENCPECKMANMAYKDGCKQCLDCGYSKCS